MYHALQLITTQEFDDGWLAIILTDLTTRKFRKTLELFHSSVVIYSVISRTISGSYNLLII